MICQRFKRHRQNKTQFGYKWAVNKALPVVLMAFAGLSAAQTAQPLGPFNAQPDPDVSRPTCSFADLKLPADVAVYAAGAYSGRTLGFQIDQSGHEARQIDVTVHSPNQPVVLMLGAYEPTVWNVGWSGKTKILAVLVGGYHRQAIAGLEPDTPRINSSYDNRGPCGYFYVTPDNLAPLNPLAKRVFERPVDMVFPAVKGKVLVGTPLAVGTPLVTSSSVRPESFRDTTAPLAGPAGVADAVRKGLLRKATAADADAWADAVLQNSPPRDIPPVAGQGVPKPDGNPGHCGVYDFNTLSCQGPGGCGGR